MAACLTESVEAARDTPEVVVAGHVSLDVFPTLYGPVEIEPGRLVVVGPAVISTGGAVANTGVALHRLGVRVGWSRRPEPTCLARPCSTPWRCTASTSYDPHLIPGILGGASGTTYDAFFLLDEARRNGARAALFGRKIKDSEHPLTFVQYLRLIADGQVGGRGGLPRVPRRSAQAEHHAAPHARAGPSANRQERRLRRAMKGMMNRCQTCSRLRTTRT